MSQAGYIALAIAIIIVLAAIAIITFVLYRKTPAPKGCENLEPEEGLCCACLKYGCPYYAQYHDKKVDADAANKAPEAGSKPADNAAKEPSNVAPKKEEEKK
jgi:flagellar basal body-associated protein FliL